MKHDLADDIGIYCALQEGTLPPLDLLFALSV